jgi:hypothetical protein
MRPFKNFTDRKYINCRCSKLSVSQPYTIASGDKIIAEGDRIQVRDCKSRTTVPYSSPVQQFRTAIPRSIYFNNNYDNPFTIAC